VIVIQRELKFVVIFLAGLVLDCCGIEQFHELTLEEKNELVELWVWVVFGVQDVGELMGSEFGLYEWYKLVGLTGVAVEGVSFEVEAYERSFFVLHILLVSIVLTISVG